MFLVICAQRSLDVSLTKSTHGDFGGWSYTISATWYRRIGHKMRHCHQLRMLLVRLLG